MHFADQYRILPIAIAAPVMPRRKPVRGRSGARLIGKMIALKRGIERLSLRKTT
jgi:hypothetical protein